ncbi:DUF6226 family protein [Corynebacterium sp. A21]|uniref:DUF6226 family protein n=1 Tax=Corynebacterium sp. A21 TaxID=3457318 RepID=UPI003FD29670
MQTWWEKRNANSGGELFSDAAVALLDEVELAFADTGAQTPGWPDPHRDPSDPHGYRASDDDEYERCLQPGRYAIVEARGRAWAEVLIRRGWARITENQKADPGRRSVTIHPLRVAPGVQPLILRSEYFIFDNGHAPCLEVWAGEPAIRLAQAPDCACDACDSGSEDLLEIIDQMIFSVVDGSVDAESGPRSSHVRTSFGGSGSTLGPTIADRDVAAGKFTAQPWVAGWQARALSAPRC